MIEDQRRLFGTQPTIWVATRSPDGAPHVAPRWFVWTEDAIYVASDRESRTWRNLEADRRVGLSSDIGRSWSELSGFSLEAEAELLAAEDPRMRQPISAWHEKYRGLLSGDGFERLTGRIERLGFLRVEPGPLATWDHAR